MSAASGSRPLLADHRDLGRAIDLLKPLGCADGWADEAAATVTMPIGRADGIVPEVVRLLDAAGISVRDVVVRRATLDDVFMSLTGHAAEDATAQPADDGRKRGAA